MEEFKLILESMKDDLRELEKTYNECLCKKTRTRLESKIKVTRDTIEQWKINTGVS